MKTKMWWLNQLRNSEPGAEGGGGEPPAPPAGGEPPAPPAGGEPPAGGAPTAMSGGEPPAPPAGGGEGGDPPSFLASLPEDWHQQIAEKAGLDETGTKMLQRYTDPAAMAKSLVDAQAKIRAGMVSSGLPENPTEEQLTEWREANGVPSEPKQYVLEDGIALSEADDRILEPVRDVALKHNIPAEAFKSLVGTMMEGRENEIRRQEEADGLQAGEARKALAEVWGRENMERNTNAIHGLLNRMPEESRDRLLNARGPDGRALFNDPAVMQFFADAAFEINPAGAVLPNDGAAGAAGIDARIAEIETKMRDDADAYYKDEALQEEYRRLLEAKEKIDNQNVA